MTPRFSKLRPGSNLMEALRMASTTRPGLATSPRESMHDGHRIVVLASEPIMGRSLVDAIAHRAPHSEDDVVVVAPAFVDSALRLGSGEVDTARARAERRLFTSVEALHRAGLHATGEGGDADPNVALADAMASSPADEAIVAT